jgi:hypothetical protein
VSPAPSCHGFDGGFGAIKEGIEHFGIQTATSGLLDCQPPMIQNGFRRGLAVFWQPPMASPGSNHREPAGARPVDEVAGQGRLISIRKAIKDASLFRLGREKSDHKKHRPRPFR